MTTHQGQLLTEVALSRRRHRPRPDFSTQNPAALSCPLVTRYIKPVGLYYHHAGPAGGLPLHFSVWNDRGRASTACLDGTRTAYDLRPDLFPP